MRYEGAIYRPPSEAYSLILQATVGCSHNACTFCSMYRGKNFRVRSLEEIREDIAWARTHYGQVRRVFLADGDALAMETADLLEVLAELKRAFPKAERVSLYAGPKNILQKSAEELRALNEAGVALAYFGIESGDAEVLRQVGKGVTPEELVEAGKKARRAGMELSATVILGLGGRERSREHAIETARVASAIDPEYLAALTLMVEEAAPLAKKIRRGEFTLPAPGEALAEMRLMLLHLDVTRCLFRSNHASNYFAVGGMLPQDRPKVLAQVDRALGDRRLWKDECFRGL